MAVIGMVVVGATAALGFHRVPSSGICFANPLGRTSLWPYDPGSGTLSLTYYFDSTGSSPTERMYRYATLEAFHAWSAAWPVLQFRPAGSAASAQIVVRYGDFGDRGFWYNHAGLTLPDVDMFGCGLSHALVQINSTYLVHDGRLQYPLPMLRHLMLHEIGHALGLRHVYGNVASVMVPTSDAYRYVKPQPYDVRTLEALYPKGLSRSPLLQRRADVAPRPRIHRTRTGIDSTRVTPVRLLP